MYEITFRTHGVLSLLWMQGWCSVVVVCPIKLANDDVRIIAFWLLKVFIATYIGEHERAKEFIGELTKFNVASVQGPILFQIYYFDALVDVLVARDKSVNGESYGRLAKCHSGLKKLRFYGKDCPSNVRNKILLIEAELDVLKHRNGDKKKYNSTIMKYKQSIEEAKQHRIHHEEAYAYERCAIAMLEWGNDVTESLEYFERAKYLYRKWGSPVKVMQLVSYVKKKSGVTMSL